MDMYEHLIADDLRQAAVVVATMLYNTAMRKRCCRDQHGRNSHEEHPGPSRGAPVENLKGSLELHDAVRVGAATATLLPTLRVTHSYHDTEIPTPRRSLSR